MATSVLASLDDDQRAAAEIVEGALLIIAGPGSGKTRALTHRVAHLIADRGVPAANCLAITFTRRAATEMQERLTGLLPDGLNRVAIHTFHSLGLAILRDRPEAAGLQRGFRIAGEAERIPVLAETLNVSEVRAQRLTRAISRVKRSGEPPAADVAEAVAAYGSAMVSRNWVDFGDLVVLAVKALTADPVLAALWRARFAFISVDEFQDVDEQQLRLLTLLAPPGANLCVIGDPNQAIYGFRGADASCFERFEQSYRPAVVNLNRNYRSTGTIVAASTQVIAQVVTIRPDAPIAAIVRDMHERIAIHAAPTDRAEAELVVRTIEELMGGHDLFTLDTGRFSLYTVSSRSNRSDSPFSAFSAVIPGNSGSSETDRTSNSEPTSAPAEFGLADFAVLYRTDAQSVALREAFARSGIPFGKHSHDLLVDQPVVGALIDAWRDSCEDAGGRKSTLVESLRAAAATLASVAPTNDVGEADGATDGATESAADVAARRATDIAARELALQQLLRVADECDGDRARFEDALTLTTEADFWDPRADRVSLLTMHAAKGLEFAVAFIIGLEDGVIPLYWNQLDDATRAEERRLFYVGMTRAKDRLFLTRAAASLARTRAGAARVLVPRRHRAGAGEASTDAGARAAGQDGRPSAPSAVS